MKLYLLYVFDYYVPSNNLTKAVQGIFRENERKVITDVNKFREELSKRIEELNKEHSRCKPVELDFYTSPTSDYGDVIMTFDTVSNFISAKLIRIVE